jgi:hypothetical protein
MSWGNLMYGEVFVMHRGQRMENIAISLKTSQLSEKWECTRNIYFLHKIVYNVRDKISLAQ